MNEKDVGGWRKTKPGGRGAHRVRADDAAEPCLGTQVVAERAHTDDAERPHAVAGMKGLEPAPTSRSRLHLPPPQRARAECELQAIFLLPKIHKIPFHIFLL